MVLIDAINIKTEGKDLLQKLIMKMVSKGLLCSIGFHGVECLLFLEYVSIGRGQMQVKRCEFGAALSEEMLEFVNTRGTDVGVQAVLIVN
jgi:hypothetical protein